MTEPEGRMPPPDMAQNVSLDALSLMIDGGDLRAIRLHGIEVLRGISYPVRDRNWGTMATTTSDRSLERGNRQLRYVRRFQTVGGGLDCTFTAEIAALADATVLTARIDMTATEDTCVNRAGFTLLHPLDHVAGESLQVRHADGRMTTTRFPVAVVPAQPVVNIVALEHRVNGVDVRIEMTGEVFEMEDQRNWSDASFKTYCRPLNKPHPFTIARGETLSQGLRVSLRRVAPPAAITGSGQIEGRMPEIALAVEPGLSSVDALGLYPAMPVLLRVDTSVKADVLERLAMHSDDVTLEIVVRDGDVPDTALRKLAALCTAAGLLPRRVVALPQAYLSSYQPGGPWPAPRPDALVPAVRAAFPDAAVGGGMFTNFTEFNRCRPDPRIVDFVTFGSSAIVHAADDMSVLQTLEALPHILDTARTLASGLPLRLGLVSIAMRSNPYGSGVLPNPEGVLKPMCMDDPRQETRFAASWAVGVIARAAASKVDSVALAMPDGPLGAVKNGNFTPLYHVLRAASSLGRAAVEVVEHKGVVTLRTARGGLAANLGSEAVDLPYQWRGRVLSTQTEAETRHDADWASGAQESPDKETLRLAPNDIVLIR